MSKEKLRFKIQDTTYGYEGVNTPQARQKDLFEFVAKMKLDASLAVPTFRQNLPEMDGTSDAEIVQMFNEAVEKRRRKDAKKAGADAGPSSPAPAAAPAAAAPPVNEQVQKLTITFQGKSFSYEGLPSKRQEALCDFLVKQNVSGADACAAFRENFPSTSITDAAVFELLEDRKRARAEREEQKQRERERKKKERAAAEAPAPPAEEPKKERKAPAAAAEAEPEPPAPSPLPPSRAEAELRQIPDAEKDSIYSFIRGVLDTPNVDIAATLKSPPATAAHASPAPLRAEATGDEFAQSTMRGDKLTVYCQEAGSATSKIISVVPRIGFADMMQVVEKKFGKPMCLAFFEGDDKIEIDDDDVLAMFLEQGGAVKLRLMVAPIAEKRKINDDKLTEVGSASTAAANVAAAVVAESVSVAPLEESRKVRGTEIKAFEGHTAAIYSCAFSPSGDKFVTASRDRTVRVWNVSDGSYKLMKGGHNGLVLSCDYSPVGDHVVSSSEDNNIKIWNVKEGTKVTSLKGHTDKVYSVQYNSTGAFIVSGSCDRTVRVWSTSTGSCVAELKGHTLPIFSCAFSKTDSGRYVASGSDDRLVKIWDWREKRDLKSLVGHTGTVWSVEFSNNDQLLVSTSMDHVINLWKVATGTVLRTMGGHETPIHQAIFTKDDRYIISCARDWRIRVWEAETGREVGSLSSHTNTVFHVSLHDRTLISSSLDTTVKLWKMDFPK